MIAYQIVDHPSIFPMACVGCMGQKGPMIDTHRQLPGYGQVYVCVRCGKEHARLFGFAKGDRLDELAVAADSLAEREREIASLRGQLAEAVVVNEDEVRQKRELRETLEDVQAYVARLETELRTQAENSLSVVGAGHGAGHGAGQGG